MRHAYCENITLDELAAIRVKHPKFNATVLLQGAQLIEFSPANNNFNNLLWLSECAEYKKQQSVRGGIPICWPWFGDLNKNPTAIKQQVPTPQLAKAHGFARNLVWQLGNINENNDRVQIEFELSHTPETQALWPFTFNLVARFTFSDTLTVELITTNLDHKEMVISQAMHTYFPTTDIAETIISPSDSCEVVYIDALDNWEEKKQIGAIKFTQETDRLYFFTTTEAAKNYELKIKTPTQQLLMTNQHTNSAVIWNPWIEKSLRLSQFNAHDYKTMFCIETANVLHDSISLESNQQHTLKLIIQPA